MKKEICTKNAPDAIGPYSQAVRVGDFLYVSGQVPIDPKTGAVVEGGIQAQAHQVFKNLEAVLSSAGCTFENVVKTTVFLTDLSDFAVVNEIYAQYFPAPCPARSCVAVKTLPKGVLAEVEVIAEV